MVVKQQQKQQQTKTLKPQLNRDWCCHGLVASHTTYFFNVHPMKMAMRMYTEELKPMENKVP